MKLLLDAYIILSIGLGALASTATAASEPDLGKDNSALLQHVKANDYVFRAVLDQCKGESIHRSNRNGLHYFTYSATCSIRSHAEDDCQFYRVTAKGTVDTSQSATVRDIRLQLQCSA